ncbi:MAG: hypothetical protein IPH95_07560 [Candidatus Promineofilum sp.]|nr:hypothetical protein [Promineifilum sp.]
MRVSRTIYWLFAWLFVVGVLTQVFFAGMTVVARQWPWTNHMSLGHLLAAPLLVMLVTMYLGKLPGRMKRLTWLLFAVYVLQADCSSHARLRPVLSAPPGAGPGRLRPRPGAGPAGDSSRALA